MTRSGLDGVVAGGYHRGFGTALAMGMGLLPSLPSASLLVASSSLSSPSSSRGAADRRAHGGDVAQQEVEVVAAPVVKDHWDGLGSLGRDVAGVAQRPEILPGAVGASSQRMRCTPCSEWRPCAPAPPAESC